MEILFGLLLASSSGSHQGPTPVTLGENPRTNIENEEAFLKNSKKKDKITAAIFLFRSHTEDWRTISHLVLYGYYNSLERKFVLVPSMCEGAGQYFKAPKPTIESFSV